MQEVAVRSEVHQQLELIHSELSACYTEKKMSTLAVYDTKVSNLGKSRSILHRTARKIQKNNK